MDNNYSFLEVNSFSISSSSDVPELVRNVQEYKSKQILIHIVSFIHNTVLVQNLKNELQKIISTCHDFSA